MSLYEIAKEQIDAVIIEIKAAVEDKQLTLSEVWKIVTKCITAFTIIASEFEGSEEDKKAVIIKAAERLYDEVIGPIDIKVIPNIVEPMVDKFVRVAFIEIVSGIVDGFDSVIKKAKE